MCLIISWVFWGRVGVGRGRTGSRDKKHSGGMRWVLSHLAASPPLFLHHPLLRISTGFFSKREVGGEETQAVLLTKPSMCC